MKKIITLVTFVLSLLGMSTVAFAEKEPDIQVVDVTDHGADICSVTTEIKSVPYMVAQLVATWHTKEGKIIGTPRTWDNPNVIKRRKFWFGINCSQLGYATWKVIWKK